MADETTPEATTLDEISEASATAENLGTEDLNNSEALYVLAECVAVLAAESRVRSAASTTMDEIRNKAIYELNREIMSDEIDEETNNTLPYLSATGSILDKIIAMEDNVVGAVNSILDNSESWVTTPDTEEG